MKPCSALPHGVGAMASGVDADTGSGVFEVRAQIRRAFVVPCGCCGYCGYCAAKLRSDPKNKAARRFLKCFRPLAQVIRAQTAIELIAYVQPEPVPESDPDSGPPLQNPCECAEERSFKRIRARTCLSAASLCVTPLEASTVGCPQRSGGTQTPGSPFFSLGFFGETKKSKSPAAATKRHRHAAKSTGVESLQGFDTSARSFDTSGRTGNECKASTGSARTVSGMQEVNK